MYAQDLWLWLSYTDTITGNLISAMLSVGAIWGASGE